MDSDSPMLERIQSTEQFSNYVTEIAAHFEDSDYKDRHLPTIREALREQVQQEQMQQEEIDDERAEHLTGRLIGALMEKAKRQAAPPASSGNQENLEHAGPLPRSAYSTLPGPLYVLLEQIDDEARPFRQIHRLIDAIEWVVKWHTSLALSELLDQHAVPDSIKPLLARGLRKPSLGLWYRFFDESLQALEDPMLPWRSWERLRGLEAKHELVNLRNRYAHGATPQDATCQADVTHYRPILRTLIHTPLCTGIRLAIHTPDACLVLQGNQRIEVDLGIPAGHSVALLPLQPGSGSEFNAGLDWTERAQIDLWPLGLSSPLSDADSNGKPVSSIGRNTGFFYFNALKNKSVEQLNYEVPVHKRDAALFEPFYDRIPLNRWKQAPSSDRRFRAHVETLTEDFVGRHEVRKRLHQFAVDGSGTHLVLGPPGVGKSALMGQILRELQAGWAPGEQLRSEDRSPMVIAYFIRRGDRDRPGPFLRHLCKRLDALYGLRRRPLPDEPAALREQLSDRMQAVEEQSDSAPPERLLLVIDGLDEAPHLARYIPEARPWLAVLVSSRETADAQSFAMHRNASKQTVPPLSRSDIRALLYQTVDKYHPGLTDAYVRAIAERSEGNPLYLKLLMEQLFQGQAQVGEVEDLPQRFGALYGETLRRVTDHGNKALTEEVLLLLAQVREPVSAAAIADLLGVRPSRARSAVQESMELLACITENEGTEDEGPERYMLFHESLRAWLSDLHGAYAASSEHMTHELADACASWERHSAHGARGYVLRHAAAHLHDAEDTERLWALLNDSSYRSTQFTHTGRYGATYRAYDHGLTTYTEINEQTPEDDARLARLCLDAGRLIEEDRRSLTAAFRSAEEGDMDAALHRIEEADAKEYFWATLRLIWIEADRQAARPDEKRSSRAAQSVLDAFVEHEHEQALSTFDWEDHVDVRFMVWWYRHISRPLPSLDVLPLLKRTESISNLIDAVLKSTGSDQGGTRGDSREDSEAMMRDRHLAQRMAQRVSPAHKQSDTYCKIATHFYESGLAQEGDDALQQATDLAQEVSHPMDRGLAFAQAGFVASENGQDEQARALFDQALSAADSAEKASSINAIRLKVASRMVRTGRDPYLQEAVEIADTVAEAVPASEASDYNQVIEAHAVRLAKRGHVTAALNNVKLVENDGYVSEELTRSKVLRRIASELASNGAPDQAIEVAARIETPGVYAKAIEKMSAFLSDEQVLTLAAESARRARNVNMNHDWHEGIQGLINTSDVLALIGEGERAIALLDEVLEQVHSLHAPQGLMAIDDLSKRLVLKLNLEQIAKRFVRIGRIERFLEITQDALLPAFKQDDGLRRFPLDSFSDVLSDVGEEGLASYFQERILEHYHQPGNASSFFKDSRVYAYFSEHESVGAVFEKAFFEKSFSATGLSDSSIQALSHALLRAGYPAPALQVAHRLSGRTHTQALKPIAYHYAQSGHAENAYALAESVEDEHERNTVLGDIAAGLVHQEQFEEALKIIGEMLEVENNGDTYFDKLSAMQSVGTAFVESGHYDYAIQLPDLVDHTFGTDYEQKSYYKTIAPLLIEAGRYTDVIDLLPLSSGAVYSETVRGNGPSVILAAAKHLTERHNHRDVVNFLQKKIGYREFEYEAQAILLQSVTGVLVKQNRRDTVQVLWDQFLEDHEAAPSDLIQSAIASIEAVGSAPDSSAYRFQSHIRQKRSYYKSTVAGYVCKYIAGTMTYLGQKEEAERIAHSLSRLRLKHQMLGSISITLIRIGQVQDATSVVASTNPEYWPRMLRQILQDLHDTPLPDLVTATINCVVSHSGADRSVVDDVIDAFLRPELSLFHAAVGLLQAYDVDTEQQVTILRSARRELLEHESGTTALLRQSLSLHPPDYADAQQGVSMLMASHLQAGRLESAAAIARACPSLGLQDAFASVGPQEPLSRKTLHDPDVLPPRLRVKYDTYVELRDDGTLDEETFQVKVNRLFDEWQQSD